MYLCFLADHESLTFCTHVCLGGFFIHALILYINCLAALLSIVLCSPLCVFFFKELAAFMQNQPDSRQQNRCPFRSEMDSELEAMPAQNTVVDDDSAQS